MKALFIILLFSISSAFSQNNPICDPDIRTSCSASYTICTSGESNDADYMCYCLGSLGFCLQQNITCFKEVEKELLEKCKEHKCGKHNSCEWKDINGRSQTENDTNQSAVLVTFLLVLVGFVGFFCLVVYIFKRLDNG